MVMSYCPHCGTRNTSNGTFCSNCGTKLKDTSSEQMNNRLSPDQLRQVQIETIWTKEKTVPKWLRGTWQAKLSFKKLEK